MAAKLGRRSGSISEINVTPLADVMIVLLIIFMVAIPVRNREPGLTLPGAAHAAEDSPSSAVVSIRADASTWMGATRFDSLAELLPRLAARLESLPGDRRQAVVKADASLAYARVGEVLDLCRRAGADEVVLVAERKPGL